MTLDLRRAATLLAAPLAALLAACPAPAEKADPPAIVLSAEAHAFPATECGEPAPAPASVQVTNGGGGTLARPDVAVTWPDGPAGWLTVTVGGAEPPFTIGLTPWTAALPAGTHTALVELTAPGAAPETLTVTWEITPITTVEPVIGADPLVLSFSGQIGGAPPAPQVVTVTNVGAGTLAPIGATPGAAWVTAVVDGATVTVTASAEGLTAGRHGTNVSLGSAGAKNDGQSVQVCFDVVQPALGLPATPIELTATEGRAPPAPLHFTVTNTGTGSLAPPVVADDADWLTATVSGAAAPFDVALAVEPAGLASGDYTATLTVSSAGASNDGATLEVHLVVVTPPRIDTSSAGAFAAGLPTRLQERLVACSVRSQWEAEARAHEISEDAAYVTAAKLAGRIAYDLAQATACAAAMEAASCQEVAEMEEWGVLPAPCAAALPPRVSVGGTCYGDSDCLSGWCGGYCPGTCATQKADGVACAYHEECTSGFCDPNVYPRVCAPHPVPGADGEACAYTWPPCLSGLACDYAANTCVTSSAEGTSCGKYGDPTRLPGCLAGLACAADMICKAVGHAGDPCSANAPCMSGTYCGAPGSPAPGTCLEYPHEAGVPCADPEGTGRYECSPRYAGWGETGTLHCNQDTQLCFYGTAVYLERCDLYSNDPALQCAPGYKCGSWGSEWLCDYDGSGGVCY
jgi:hypothetical protein